MPTPFSNPRFDYGQVTDDEADKLRDYEGELARSRKRVANEVIKHGEILHGVQQMLASYSGGVFVAWLESSGISTRSAYNAIGAFVEFGSFANLQNFEVSAMYALTKNQTAKKKAMKLADRGVKVTHAAAQKLIEEAESTPKPPEQETAVVGETGEVGRTDSGGTARETNPMTSKGRKEESGNSGALVEGEKCPNCAGHKWKNGKCAKCSHPQGEPAGDVDEARVKAQQKKTVKTIEALMRAIDDLHWLAPSHHHGDTITSCKSILKTVKEWK